MPSSYKEIKIATTSSQGVHSFEHGGGIESREYTADKVLETTPQNKENKNQKKRPLLLKIEFES